MPRQQIQTPNPLSSHPHIYFVGAGGIGMANLVRYTLSLGCDVAGYDRVQSQLSQELEAEGTDIIYTDNPDLIPQSMRSPQTTLVVYTPAVPESNRILTYFRTHGYEVIKRAALLGIITRGSKGICIAGSHGKTTTSSMLANIMRLSPQGCNAFLGGVLRNTGSNLVLAADSPYSVIEADEYDRSFHRLNPWTAVITSTDPDHLDIYGDAAHYTEAFEIFTSLIRPGGHLLMHAGLTLHPRCPQGVTIHTYTGKESATTPAADWKALNIRLCGDHILFDLAAPAPFGTLRSLRLGTPIEINVDNAVAATAAALLAGVPEQAVRKGLETFMGAKRRFEFHVRPGEGRAVLIDDYAHSPNEISASIASVRRLFPGQRLAVIFQPHLYSRTRDFAPQFAQALSDADCVVLPEIYPARELPIPGVDSSLILKDIQRAEKHLVARADLADWIKKSNFDILMTLGAADLDRLLPEFTRILTSSAANDE